MLHVFPRGDACGRGPCREVPDEAARKCVSSPSGVNDLVKRVGRRKKDFALVEHERTVLSLLDDHGRGSHGVNGLGRLRQEMFAGQLPRLLVVDGEHVHAPNDLF